MRTKLAGRRLWRGFPFAEKLPVTIHSVTWIDATFCSRIHLACPKRRTETFWAKKLSRRQRHTYICLPAVALASKAGFYVVCAMTAHRDSILQTETLGGDEN